MLNTGRIRDQWHSMTRTAKTPCLMGHIAEPIVEVIPADAARVGLAPADIARLATPRGSMLARVVVADRQRAGSVFVPMHWTDHLASRGHVDTLIEALLDPVSGQPALTQTEVEVTPYPARWFAVAVCRHGPRDIPGDYWALAPIAGGWRIEMASVRAPEASAGFLTKLLGTTAPAVTDVVAYHDRISGQERHAAFAGDTSLGIQYAAAEPVAVSCVWLGEQLAPGAIVRRDQP